MCEIREHPEGALKLGPKLAGLQARPQDEILCIFFTEAQLKWWKIAFGSLKWWVFRWLVLVGLGNHAGRTVSQPPSTNSCFTIGSEFKVYLSEAAAALATPPRAHFPVSHIMTTTQQQRNWLPFYYISKTDKRRDNGSLPLPIFPLLNLHFCMTRGWKRGSLVLYYYTLFCIILFHNTWRRY